MPIWWSTEPNSSNNWDLEAVVRGCCLPAGPETAFDTFSTLKEEESIDGCREDLLSFPDLTAEPASLHELEELCIPFFAGVHNQQQQLLLSPRKSSPSASASSEPLPLASSQQPQRSLSQTPRSKRSRKKQQKKVVCEIPGDAASSDMWAWRKYGQKPIKGSPYPRGYYRCSSSKACLARKQVERSRADPAMLVITYTAEHNHPVPTHRNSLAGSTRNKLPPAPATLPTASSEGDRRRQLQQPSEEVDGDVGGEEEGSLTVGDMEMVGEDEMLFMDLGATTFADTTLFVDDADFPNHFLSQPWKIDNSNSAVASCSW